MLEVYALLVFGLITGAVAHLPLAASIPAGLCVLGLLAAFWLRERRAGECDEAAA